MSFKMERSSWKEGNPRGSGFKTNSRGRSGKRWEAALIGLCIQRRRHAHIPDANERSPQGWVFLTPSRWGAGGGSGPDLQVGATPGCCTSRGLCRTPPRLQVAGLFIHPPPLCPPHPPGAQPAPSGRRPEILHFYGVPRTPPAGRGPPPWPPSLTCRQDQAAPPPPPGVTPPFGGDPSPGAPPARPGSNWSSRLSFQSPIRP